MVSTRRCINRAGALSRIRLPTVPVLEEALIAGPDAVAALACWCARLGDIVTVCDPQQQEYRARILRLEPDRVELLPFARIAATESAVRIELFQALPDKERFELVLQKATELGVARITPLQTKRSSSVRERDAGQRKSHRWPDLLLRAARQCRRAEIPELAPETGWQEALTQAVAADLALLCYEGQVACSLAESLQRFQGQSVAVIVGPEGGFEKREIEQARALGIQLVGLGPRVLRTETAAIVAVGAIQFALGNLSNQGETC